MWGIVFVLLVTLALFFDAKAVSIGLFAIGLLYFGGGKLLETAFGRLQVTRTSQRTYLFPGETAHITLQFYNPTYIPITWLSGYDRLPSQLAGGRVTRWMLSVPPKSSVTTGYDVRASRRGVYTVGPVEMEAGDPLGLHRRTGTSQSFHDIVVYPEILPIGQLGLPSNLPVGNVRAQRRIYPDPNRLAGVRPYQHGDPKQWVHWKATARTRELHVKQFEHTVTLDTFILLNFNERDYKIGVRWHDVELAITVSAALANHLTTLGETFGFVTNAHLQYYGAIQPVRTERSGVDRVVRVMPRKGSSHLMRVLEILAAAYCEPCADFVDMVSHEARHFGWGATLLIVTPVDSEALIERSFMLGSSGYRVLIFVTGEKVVHAQFMHEAPHAGVKVFHVRRGSERPLAVLGGGAVG